MALLALVWLARLWHSGSTRLLLADPALPHAAAFYASTMLPAVLVWCCGLHWYARCGAFLSILCHMPPRALPGTVTEVPPQLLCRLFHPCTCAPRRRRYAALLIRLCALAACLRPLHLELLMTPAEGGWHTAGRLLLACSPLPLHVAPLGFRLRPATTAALQAVCVAAVLWRVQGICAAGYMQRAGPRASLNRCVPARLAGCLAGCLAGWLAG